MDQRPRQATGDEGRAEGAALGGVHRGVALRPGPGLRRPRRPPLRRRRPARLRYRGLRAEMEVAASKLAVGFDTRAPRGCREWAAALPGDGIRRLGVDQSWRV